MKCYCKTILFLSLLPLLSCILAQPSFAEIKIGILAKRGANRVISQWEPTGAYLTERLGEQVVIIPVEFSLIDKMVKLGRIDFLLANSAFFVEMEKKYQARAIATMINAKNHRPLDQFGGVVFTRKDSSIRELKDIRGKKFMAVKFSSFGGCQMAWRLLLDNNIDPQKDTAAFMEAGTHDHVVYAVQKGVADVGTVRTDTMERMQSEGKISMDEFHIINKIEDDFSFVHSTRLYPEWPMAALKQTPLALSARLAEALWKMEPDSTAAQAASVVGWKKAADYTSVQQCLQTIGYGSFAQ